MTMHGADIEQLHKLAQHFSRSGEILETDVLGTIKSAASSQAWQGPDFAAFQNACSSTIIPQILQAADALHRAALRITLNAHEQTLASSAEGSFVTAAESFTRASIALGMGVATTASAASQASSDADSQDSKPSLESILLKNQVSDDKQVEWMPKILWFINAQEEPVVITQGEAKMLDALWAPQKYTFQQIHDTAFSTAEKHFPPTNFDGVKANDDHTDAFRHAYWSGSLARNFGPEWAEQYTTAHERVPGNNPAREAMDLHNNNIGINIVRNNPNISDEQLQKKIHEAVENGDTVVIDSTGNLAWSNDVPVGQTGHANPHDAPLPGRTPEDPNASAS